MIVDRSILFKTKQAKRDAERQARRKWHIWFAWYPVQVPSYSGRWVWLENIEIKYWSDTSTHKRGGIFGGDVTYYSDGWSRRLIKGE